MQVNVDEFDWYVDAIGHEILELVNIGFTGNIHFKVNIKSGGICNMNVELLKSVKKVNS